MPIHPDFAKIKREMIKKYGKKKGEEVYYSWLNKHGYDDSKPIGNQKSKSAEASSFDEWLSQAREMVTISIPAYKMPYVAAPKNGKDGPLSVKAITLEPITNINGWRVVPEEFARVAAQYKEGRQLRLNHSKDVQEIIGKSFDSKVIQGKDIAAYMGQAIEGIIPDSEYVVTEFEADPQDQQVRTNILRGYVDTGSIGLDAKATCDECGEPLAPVGDDMVKTCRHLESAVKLSDVEVKEYSYVSEPAYPHSKVLPTFAAAVSNLPKPKLQSEESSLSQYKQSVVSDMSAAIPKVEAVAAAKKADSDDDHDDDESIPKKYADAIMDAYKKGMTDARKFRADDSVKSEADSAKKADSESDADASVKASAKTDQITRIAPTAETTVQAKRDDWVDRVIHPLNYVMEDPALKELFRAATEAPTTPSEIRNKFKGRFG